jgi:Mrp family chromosome partitioning ATPase
MQIHGRAKLGPAGPWRLCQAVENGATFRQAVACCMSRPQRPIDGGIDMRWLRPQSGSHWHGQLTVPVALITVLGCWRSASNNAFSLIRARLRYFNFDRELRMLLVTSAAPGDGKTTVARHLAAAAARTGSTVLLLEGDLRRPTMAQQVDIASWPGLLAQRARTDG